MRALVEVEYRESYLEIEQIHPQRKLVTCIEVLSPSNKDLDSPGWRQYVRKRQAFMHGAANFVEIDLLRGGRRMPMEDEWPEEPFYLLVARKERAPVCEVWPGHFREPLPEIPLPLAAPDADVPLAIQPLIEAIYTRSRYPQLIDYRRHLRPRLKRDDAAWLEKRLRGSRRRR